MGASTRLLSNTRILPEGKLDLVLRKESTSYLVSYIRHMCTQKERDIHLMEREIS